jgi:hypothetical protein
VNNMARTPTFKSLREAAEAGYHGKSVNIEGKGLQKVAFADKAYDRRMAERSAQAGRSVEGIARTATAAIDRAEETRRPRPNPRRDTGMTKSPRPQANLRRSDVATSVSTPSVRAEPIDRRVRGAQDASPTRSAVTAVPASIQRLLDEAPGGAARAQAERIADQVRAGRMPLREAIDKINALFSGITSPMAGRNEELRQLRTATGMAKGGMVKKGNTDRRKKGMFYDSKSPRGYK